MLAIVKAGGKQYKAREGALLKMNKIIGDVGDTIVFDEVLALLGEEGADSVIGAPLVAGASVKATLVSQERDDKILIFKKKRRKHHRRKNGHRQYISLVRIEAIQQ